MPTPFTSLTTLLAALALMPTVARAQDAPPAAPGRALTICNQNFAVVRQTIPLSSSGTRQRGAASTPATRLNLRASGRRPTSR